MARTRPRTTNTTPTKRDPISVPVRTELERTVLDLFENQQHEQWVCRLKSDGTSSKSVGSGDGLSSANQASNFCKSPLLVLRIASFLEPQDMTSWFSCCKACMGTCQTNAGLLIRLDGIFQWFRMLSLWTDQIHELCRKRNDRCACWNDFCQYFTKLAIKLQEDVYGRRSQVHPLHRCLLAESILKSMCDTIREEMDDDFHNQDDPPPFTSVPWFQGSSVLRGDELQVHWDGLLGARHLGEMLPLRNAQERIRQVLLASPPQGQGGNEPNVTNSMSNAEKLRKLFTPAQLQVVARSAQDVLDDEGGSAVVPPSGAVWVFQDASCGPAFYAMGCSTDTCTLNSPSDMEILTASGQNHCELVSPRSCDYKYNSLAHFFCFEFPDREDEGMYHCGQRLLWLKAHKLFPFPEQDCGEFWVDVLASEGLHDYSDEDSDPVCCFPEIWFNQAEAKDIVMDETFALAVAARYCA
jgi:hypothetical protein